MGAGQNLFHPDAPKNDKKPLPPPFLIEKAQGVTEFSFLTAQRTPSKLGNKPNPVNGF
jgi:hypothetical protein